MYMGAYAYINRNLMDVEFVHILRKMENVENDIMTYKSRLWYNTPDSFI